jgi:zinc transport system substrate-binding protein
VKLARTICRALCFGLLWLAGWALPAAAQEPLRVVVMIVPQQYFVEQLGGDRVAVTILVPPGADPHVYEPKPKNMVQISSADLYIAMGTPEERVWLPRLLASRPDLSVLHQDAGIPKLAMMDHRHDDHETHRHKAEKAGPVGTPPSTTKGAPQSTAAAIGNQLSAPVDERHLDPHIWLSPKMLRIQAETISRGLREKDPAGAEYYRARLQSFQHLLDRLDQQLTALFSNLHGPAAFLTLHPSWGYFARDYGLNQVPIEVEGKEPSPKELEKLMRRVTRERIPVLLVQPQFSRRLSDVVARQTGIQVITADPLALNWEDNLLNLARQLAATLNQERTP